MLNVIGIDAGGTYTDGVVLSLPDGQVLSKSKTPTTHTALYECIRSCIQTFPPHLLENVSYVCLSTTLATNALVEDHGRSEGLILIGGQPEGKLPSEQIRLLPGKPDIMGRIREPLNEMLVEETVESMRGKVQSIAVSGYASVRNPQHELFVKDRIRQLLGIPAVCAHELTGSLGFYERTITAALNARLIPLICDLIDAVEKSMEEFHISAPLMIVRGDGTLMSAQQARERPIETVLSGPAASIAGGLYLSNEKDALILDMGGTTTDIANIANHKPRLRTDGANVGGWFTRVRACEVYTVGLGGDSRIRVNAEGVFTVGPERAVPFCTAAKQFPPLSEELSRLFCDPEQPYRYFWQHEDEACFLARPFTPGDDKEQLLLDALSDGPHTLYHLREKTELPDLSTRVDKLVKHGFLTRIAMTPTDLLHAAGSYCVWDEDAARLLAEMRAARLSLSPDAFYQRAAAAISQKLARTCLEAGLYFDEQTPAAFSDPISRYFLDRLFLLDDSSVLQARPRLRKNVVAIGAPSAAWVGSLQKSLGANVLFPVHAEVAGAVGAAVGQMLEQADILIRLDPVTKKYTVFTADVRETFDSMDTATEFAEKSGRDFVSSRLAFGPAELKTEIRDFMTDDPLENRKVFVERHVLVTGSTTLLK
ncbi:MAG: hydantoinase/oxoprolinase family protein [Oscillibacter sp.]|nr:hydantoinase/oxoprolinase family protein [Oscillibacter sp.]